MNKISLVNVTTVSLFMFSFIGTLPLFYSLDEYRFNNGVQEQSVILSVLFWSSINIVVFLLGVIFTRNIVGLRTVKFSSLEIYPLSSLQRISLIVMFGFCIAILLLYLSKVDKVAVMVALAESVSSAKEYRSAMGNSFQGNYHWYSLVMHDIGSLLSFTSFVLWLKYKKKSLLLAFFVTFSYSVFVAVMATEKAPVAWLLIGLFMTYFLVRNDGFVPLKSLFLFGWVIILLLIVVYLLFMGTSDISSALWSVFSRAFSGSISPAYFYLEFFPLHQDFLMGRTFPNPGGLMPYEPYRYTYEVMNWRFPSLAERGVVGTAPTVFWGEAYANFGRAGIPVIAFFMGGLTSFYSYLVSRIEINPLSIGFIVWLILEFKDLSTTGFSGYFYSVSIICLAFLVLFIFCFRGYIRIRNNKSQSS